AGGEDEQHRGQRHPGGRPRRTGRGGRGGGSGGGGHGSTVPRSVGPGPANVSYLYREAELHDRRSPRAEPAPPVPAARAAQAADDDGGRDRPLDVAVGGVPAALAAGEGDEGLPVPAGGQEGGAHRLRGAAGAPRRGDARAAGDGGGGARPGAGGGERTAAGGVVPDPDDRPRSRCGQRARAAAPGPASGDGSAGGRRCL